MTNMTIFVAGVWIAICVGAGFYIYTVNKGYKKKNQDKDKP